MHQKSYMVDKLPSRKKAFLGKPIVYTDSRKRKIPET